MRSIRLNYIVDVIIVLWLFGLRTCEGLGTNYDTITDTCLLGNLTPWRNYAVWKEVLVGGLSKQKVMLNSGCIWAPIVEGLLDIRPIMYKWHNVQHLEQLYDPQMATRPLIPDRKYPERPFPAHILNQGIKEVARIAEVPMADVYCAYSCMIGHSTHMWEMRVGIEVAAKKFRWENKDSRADMFNTYGARNPRHCQRRIGEKVTYSESEAAELHPLVWVA